MKELYDLPDAKHVDICLKHKLSRVLCEILQSSPFRLSSNARALHDHIILSTRNFTSTYYKSLSSTIHGWKIKSELQWKPQRPRWWNTEQSSPESLPIYRSRKPVHKPWAWQSVQTNLAGMNFLLIGSLYRLAAYEDKNQKRHLHSMKRMKTT